MKQFQGIERLDTSILYVLELVSSLSVLLLAFGLIARMANILTKGIKSSQIIWLCNACGAGRSALPLTPTLQALLSTFRYYQVLTNYYSFHTHASWKNLRLSY